MTMIGAIRTALRALVRNALRTALAMLGIVIAVAAVIATVAIGAGAQQKLAAQMASLGSNLLTVMSGSVSSHGVAAGAGAGQSLTRDDGVAIEKELGRFFSAVAPMSRGGGQVVSGDVNWSTQFIGSSASYLDVREWALAEGAIWGREEDAAAAKVCVLGRTVADKLFGSLSPVGETIRVKHMPCRIVGVLAQKGTGGWGQDQDDVVLMPITTLMRRLTGADTGAVGSLMLAARSPALLAEGEREVTALLRQRHHLTDDADNDFQIRNLTEMQNAANDQASTVKMLLIVVAAISLVVGAIGIANLMLVSVTERTREIGIRMAVGATGSDILVQFLVEALVLSATGGLVGIGLGVLVTRVIAAQAGWSVLLSPVVMAGTLGIAGLCGVVAGFYPALRASRMDPIEALRYE